MSLGQNTRIKKKVSLSIVAGEKKKQPKGSWDSIVELYRSEQSKTSWRRQKTRFYFLLLCCFSSHGIVCLEHQRQGINFPRQADSPRGTSA
jgi:hypothetical protein